MDNVSAAYLAGYEDGCSWINERITENSLRKEYGDGLLSLIAPETGWDEACINNAGRDIFARVCSLSKEDVEQRSDAFFKACKDYNLGAYDATLIGRY